MKGCAIPQEVSHWLPTAMAWVQARVWYCGICGGQSGSGAGFLRVHWFPLPIFIPAVRTQLPSSVIWGWYNRPVVGCSSKWTQSHPTKNNKNKINDTDEMCSNWNTPEVSHCIVQLLKVLCTVCLKWTCGEGHVCLPIQLHLQMKSWCKFVMNVVPIENTPDPQIFMSYNQWPSCRLVRWEWQKQFLHYNLEMV
jgi:hypothetical protein